MTNMKPYVFYKEETGEYEAPVPFTRFARLLIDVDLIEDTKLSIAIFRYEPGQIGPCHKHKKETEVYYILKGHGTLRLDKEIVKLHEGTIVYIPPGVEHETKNNSKKELEFLAIFCPATNFNDIKLKWNLQ